VITTITERAERVVRDACLTDSQQHDHICSLHVSLKHITIQSVSLNKLLQLIKLLNVRLKDTLLI